MRHTYYPSGQTNKRYKRERKRYHRAQKRVVTQAAVVAAEKKWAKPLESLGDIDSLPRPVQWWAKYFLKIAPEPKPQILETETPIKEEENERNMRKWPAPKNVSGVRKRIKKRRELCA